MLIIRISTHNQHIRLSRGVSRGGFGGQAPPPRRENFFNLQGFFEKKIRKPPLNFSFHTKKFKNPPPLWGAFLATPLRLRNDMSDINDWSPNASSIIIKYQAAKMLNIYFLRFLIILLWNLDDLSCTTEKFPIHDLLYHFT